jgi:hypothetical protein
MHPLADFLDWYCSAFICVPDAFVNGREGFFILFIRDRSRVFKVMFPRLSHMLNSISNRSATQSFRGKAYAVALRRTTAMIHCLLKLLFYLFPRNRRS